MSQNHWAPLRGETSAPLRRLARSTNETWVSLVRKQKKSKKHIVQSLPKACSLQNHFSHWHFSASASYHKHVNVANGQSSSIESRSMDDTERSKLLRLLVYNIPQDSSVAAWCAHISSQAMSGAAERLIASLHVFDLCLQATDIRQYWFDMYKYVHLIWSTRRGMTWCPMRGFVVDWNDPLWHCTFCGQSFVHIQYFTFYHRISSKEPSVQGFSCGSLPTTQEALSAPEIFPRIATAEFPQTRTSQVAGSDAH